MDKITRIQAQYSRQCSLHVCKNVFTTRKILHGQDLFNLTPDKQINYFVIKQLFRTWQHEVLQLQSPYFDYAHPEVKKNLVKFMNFLSQYIALHEQDLEPLLAAAIDESLLLIRQPREFYHKELVLSVQSLSTKYLRNTQRYVHIHTAFLHAFVQDFQNNNAPEIDKTQAQQLFDKVAQNTPFATDDPTPFLLSIHNIHPLPTELSQSHTQHTPPTDKPILDPAQQQLLRQHLFDNQKTAFQLAMKELNACHSFDQAKHVLLTKYAKSRQWNPQNPYLKTWLTILQEHFLPR